MSRVRSKNTSPELILRRALRAKGIFYRIHVLNLPGKPDLVIKRFSLAVFVDGGFWHGYNWSVKKDEIKSNRDFWITKIEGNMKRDSANNEKLHAMGFTVMRFWDHQVRKNLSACVNQILLYIEAAKSSPVPEHP